MTQISFIVYSPEEAERLAIDLQMRDSMEAERDNMIANAPKKRGHVHAFTMLRRDNTIYLLCYVVQFTDPVTTPFQAWSASAAEFTEKANSTAQFLLHAVVKAAQQNATHVEQVPFSTPPPPNRVK